MKRFPTLRNNKEGSYSHVCKTGHHSHNVVWLVWSGLDSQLNYWTLLEQRLLQELSYAIPSSPNGWEQIYFYQLCYLNIVQVTGGVKCCISFH